MATGREGREPGMLQGSSHLPSHWNISMARDLAGAQRASVAIRVAV